MAGEIDTLMRGESTATEPHFGVSLRGYTRRQVDHYARTVEAQIGSVLAANRDLESQVRALTIQLRQAHDEIGDLRRRPPTADKVAYRHLGARVEQILSEAESEAGTIRQSAIEEAERERAELTAEVTQARATFEREARQAHEERERELAEMAELRKLHAEQERDLRRRLDATRADLLRAEASAQRQRSDAAELLTAAQEAYDRLHASAMANAEAVQADLDVKMRELRARAYEEASSVALAAEIYALDTVSAAEEQAESLRAAEATAAKRAAAQANQKAPSSKHAAQSQNARKGGPTKVGVGPDAAEVPAPAAAAAVEDTTSATLPARTAGGVAGVGDGPSAEVPAPAAAAAVEDAQSSDGSTTRRRSTGEPDLVI